MPTDVSNDEHHGRSRRTVLLATGAIGTAALAGCAGGGGDDDERPVTHERVGTGDVAFDHWTSAFYSPDEDESLQPEAASAMRARFDEWAEENPEYRANLVYQADLDQWESQLVTRASNGEAPASSTLDSVWVPDNREYLQPLNDYVDDVDDFFPFVQETAMEGGDLLAAWFYTGLRCLYYRTDLVEEYGDGDPPRTWDDLLEVGGAIADWEGIDGFTVQMSALDTLPFFWGQGGELVDDDGMPVLGDEDNYDALLSTFEFFADLVEAGVTPQRVGTLDDPAQLGEEAANGQSAMFIGSNSRYQISIEPNDDDPERWDVAEIPMREADQFATGVGGWTEGVYAEDGDVAEAAKSFAAKAVEPATMGRYCEEGSQLPTRESVFDDDEIFSSDTFRFQDQFREFLRNGVARPSAPIYSEAIAEEWVTAKERVFTQQSSPEEAVGTMLDNVADSYDGDVEYDD
ncbi:twin-arginine translocation pathway signal protein [Halobiforma lacisalsi AJ5]|uniref:Twin-arginine translocation pathway signal protein n=1 Tax=Natronobacterium lacisalsi AJ5 TaxID=358396 RepID=M0L5U7_NATLA|nr:extracellular solute-binding protein [Halobiforma lacisalsi]APW96361.1 twin-arginine translocation pathway signal protein [Halobiforma lacisalsi AJ5]EMA27365.1 twin-arginine translocation pathway signal protein [Halobiforma lacisalsi AJ5]